MTWFARNALAFLLAVITTYCVAAIAATQSVMARLAEMGVAVPPAERIATTVGDLSGMFATFAPLLLIALGLGFVIAAIVARFKPDWKRLGYPLAGFVAVITMHLLMRMALDLTPVAAARSTGGLFIQGVAGAIGGLVFYFFSTAATTTATVTATTAEAAQ